MRILIATSHRNIVGGVEKYLQTVIPALCSRGHQVAIVCEYHFNPALESIDSPGLGLTAWSTAELLPERALRSIAEWRPDVVYSQGLETTVVQAALLNAYPTVLYAHYYVGTCATGQKCHWFPVPRPCSRQFGTACLVLHYPRRCGGLNPMTMVRMFRRCCDMNALLPRYKAVLVASTHMAREFQRHGVTQQRIRLLPLPLQQEAQAEAPEHPFSPSRILFLGRLNKLKGVRHLLEAVPIADRRLGRPLSLTIAGDGPELASLASLAKEGGRPVEFMGWVNNAKRAELIRKSDLLAVPSVWPEPFGLVGIEAGAYGIPAVAYDVGGIPDWLIPGYSGELAPSNPPTPDGLARAIFRAISDPVHYAHLRQGARSVAQRFRAEEHLSKLEQILAEVQQEGIPACSSGSEHVHI